MDLLGLASVVVCAMGQDDVNPLRPGLADVEITWSVGAGSPLSARGFELRTVAGPSVVFGPTGLVVRP